MKKLWGRKVTDLSYYTFQSMLNYKCIKHGKKVIKIGRFEPSSQICSNCGHRQKLSLSDRIYECPVCKRKEDRDIHAANNMIYFYQQIKDRPGTDQTLKLVSYNSYKEFVAKQESTMSLA